MESTSESRVVGNAFVQQYYILMHKDPGQLHRFYLEQSSFVHGGAELGSEKAVVGQKVREPCDHHVTTIPGGIEGALMYGNG